MGLAQLVKKKKDKAVSPGHIISFPPSLSFVDSKSKVVKEDTDSDFEYVVDFSGTSYAL